MMLILPLREQTIIGAVAPGTIAPGTYGKIDIKVDTTGTEVLLQYDLNISIENCPTNLEFYSDAEYKNWIENTRTGTGDEGDPKIATINIERFVGLEEHGVHDETIYWKWDFETDPSEGVSNPDLVDSEDMGKTATASIVATGFEILKYEEGDKRSCKNR